MKFLLSLTLAVFLAGMTDAYGQSAAPAASASPAPAAAVPQAGTGGLATAHPPVEIPQPKFMVADKVIMKVQADEPYVVSDWTNLTRSLIRAEAINIQEDNTLLDEYALISECGLYKEYYQDDFKWNEVRKAIRKSIELNKATYPIRYHYDTTVQLDRYDFAAKTYRFREKSIINRANVFLLYDVSGVPCEAGGIKNLPHKFRALVNDPISITGVSLSPEDAEALLHYMDVSGNTDHVLYLNFELTLQYIYPIHREVKNVTTGAAVYIQGADRVGEVNMEAKLDRVRFYADPDGKILIYTLTP